MATSSKFDLSCDSPDRPLYTGGQRGSHTAQLDRSGSFRECIENPILSSLPSMARSSSVVAQGDVVSFFQCLRFDPKVVAAEHKSSRQGDFKRNMNVIFSTPADDSPAGSSKGKLLPSPSPEEIKRAKAGIRDSSVKARERLKIFNEALSVFNKFFPTIPSKKRSRSEGFSNDRPSASLSSDRSVLTSSLSKVGIQNHAVTGGFEVEQQKSEERSKNVIPNKRTRTSMMDVRGNALVRPSGTIDRDREMIRIANGNAVQAEDRALSIGVDGWEKTKMKKKRSGIKPDVSPSAVSTKPADGYRELKQGIQQRPVTDARSRLINDSHGFRPGVANGIVGAGKSDGISQPIGLTLRASIPRTDLDSGSLLGDRRERPIGSDKERVNPRAVNKGNVRDDFNSASPSTSSKMNTSIRAPRSGSGTATKLSPVVHRSTATSDWELSHCANKPPAAGATNRKRTASARSSSPPVAQWAGQRPQKISRTARRTNLVPIVSNNDESPALDTVSDVSGNETGLGFARRLMGNSPQQVKMKCDHLSSAALSESEESGAPEIKSKDKGKRSDETDEKAGQNVQKASTLGISSRKNKLVVGEDLGDGVRRQGRTGRGFSSTRSLMPMAVEKLGNVGTAKQLRSARLGFDKNESKGGRPPTRKLTDRKAYARQKHTTVNAAADFLVGSDDGHEELLASASSVINPIHALSSSFWRQMEPYFGFISEVDVAYLKQQGNLESSAPSTKPVLSDVNNCSNILNGNGFIENEREVGLATGTRGLELFSQHSAPGATDIPLCQRLLAAMISEEDFENGNGDMEFDAYGTGLELEELRTNGLLHWDNFEHNVQFSGHAELNGYEVPGKREHAEPAIDTLGTPKTGFPYDKLQTDEKLHLEIQSIGIFLEPVVEDEGIGGDISKLEEKYHHQVLKKRDLLDKLLKSASGVKELQEKEFEERAHDKLITMAFEKYMACWDGTKSSSNKIAKQAALAFIKRTLERCHRFEDTGKSCFAEPLYRDMFLSGSSHLSGAQSVDTPVDGESKLFANALGHSLEARVSASVGSQASPRTSRLSQNGESCCFATSDLLPPLNNLSEQSTGKEDSWSNRVKKRELFLDDVGGVNSTSGAASGIGGSLSSSTKGKRSERDREGKGHNREASSRNGTNKIGRPTLSNVKGERKSKTKPKHKTQLSASVNGLIGKIQEQPKPALPTDTKSSEITTNSNAKEKDGFGFDALDDPDSLDLSNLLPEIDDVGQGQDLGSWLNIEDDGLHDNDFMGLQIPMDDLSDLNMMV